MWPAFFLVFEFLGVNLTVFANITLNIEGEEEEDEDGEEEEFDEEEDDDDEEDEVEGEEDDEDGSGEDEVQVKFFVLLMETNNRTADLHGLVGFRRKTLVRMEK